MSGYSLEDVAAELMCSPAKVSRIETGQRSIQPRDVRDLSRFYRVTAAEQAALLELAAEAGRRAWWSGLRSLPEGMVDFVGLESAAVETRVFHPTVIPGLLQTAEYAHELVRTLRPPGAWSPEEQDQIVEARTRRQERVLEGSLLFKGIIDEISLVRHPGTADVIERQIRQVLEFARLPNVEVNIVPISCGSYPGMDGGFHWLRFPRDSLGDVVFVEGHLGLYLLDKDAQASRYFEIFEDMQARWALSAEASLAHLRSYLSPTEGPQSGDDTRTQADTPPDGNGEHR